jgi:hypothetical protein
MALEEIKTISSYLRKGKIINGSFPITISGNIHCYADPGMTKEERERILAEEHDPSFYLQRQYLVTNDGNYYQSVDGSGDFLLYF